MHESSRKVAETLQEIYSTDWDGHEELKAIADVSPLMCPCCPQGSPLTIGGAGKLSRGGSLGMQPGTYGWRGGWGGQSRRYTPIPPFFHPAEQ